MCGRGGACVAEGVMRGRGHSRGAWQGVCMAGGVHGRGCAWQGGMCGRGCMAGGVHGRGHACHAHSPVRYYSYGIRSMSGWYTSY